jgi:hypothetical protein
MCDTFLRSLLPFPEVLIAEIIDELHCLPQTLGEDEVAFAIRRFHDAGEGQQNSRDKAFSFDFVILGHVHMSMPFLDGRQLSHHAGNRLNWLDWYRIMFWTFAGGSSKTRRR